MRTQMITITVALASLVACKDSNSPAPIQFGATLSGANERPSPVTTNGTGTFTATLGSNNVLTYSLSFSGLTSASNNAHIHGPIASTGTAPAGVLVNLNSPTAGRTITLGGTSGTAQGTIDLGGAITATVSGDSLRKLFDAGKLYVNVHTVNNGGGEILGIIARK